MKNILIGDIKKMFAYIKRNQKNLIALSKEYKQNIINANLIKELYIHHGKIEAEENEYFVDPENEDINVGDSVTIGQDDYDVVGIFESGNSNQDMSLFMDLGKTQELVQDEGNITAIFVKVNPDYDVDAVADDITNQYGDNLTTVTSLSDMAMVGDMIDMLNGASWGISLLAIIIGAVGIINTMLMSVLERTRELGVLKAVGWSGKRILGMIIGESIVITLFAGVVGSIVGVIVVE